MAALVAQTVKNPHAVQEARGQCVDLTCLCLALYKGQSDRGLALATCCLSHLVSIFWLLLA